MTRIEDYQTVAKSPLRKDLDDPLARARTLNPEYLYGELAHTLADEVERLRGALAEAVCIANGSGADFTWQARERLRILQNIANGCS